MKAEKQIDRSAQGAKEVIMTDIPKSGFNLTYNNYTGGLILGRLIPMAFQWLMPNDKFSGSNQHMLTFEQLATPVLSDVNVSMHNFYCTLRAVDKDLPMLLTPTKLNNMSAAGSTPRFNVSTIMTSILSEYFKNFSLAPNTGALVNATITDGMSAFISVTGRGIRLIEHLRRSYADDVVYDLAEKLDPIIKGWKASTNAATSLAFAQQYVRAICDFFLGQGSMADYFGYPIVNHSIADEATKSYFDELFVGSRDWHWNDFRFALDAPLVNEYPLRIMYTIWLEYYRNFDVEPLTNDTPDYHTWGSTPLALDTLVQLLVMRPRCWAVDAFISAGVDDISRHIFAPILGDVFGNNNFVEPTASAGASDVYPLADKWSQTSATYVGLDGSEHTVNIPLPSGVLSAFVSDYSNPDIFGLELNTMRKAHMMENYWKRVFYGGQDEYRDRCLSIWGSRIEDYRINRPELLSSSFDSVAVKQEVANTGAMPGSASGQAEQGQRLATATASTEGSDGFTSFSPEFGMYIGIMSIMPRAQYDPLCLQLTMAKTFDFPHPQFANSMEETIQNIEMVRSVAGDVVKPFGFAPYAHAWRYRVDSVHGQYLDEKRDYSFARFWRATISEDMPILNHYFLHCHPRLDMFVDTILLDGQVYGVGKHNFLVERVLPTPVETI